jgi:hypothetical protein
LRPVDREQRLRRAYAAFNARDVDAVLSLMTLDVDWPNAWEGGRVRGHGGVRAYWTRQWASIDPSVEPLSVTTRPDGRVAVEVRQVVRALDGTPLQEERVPHVYAFDGDLIARMDVEDAPVAG